MRILCFTVRVMGFIKRSRGRGGLALGFGGYLGQECCVGLLLDLFGLGLGFNDLLVIRPKD